MIVLAVDGSYPEFLDNCFLGQFIAGKDVLQVLADGAHVHPEQLGHQLLRQPQGFVIVAGFDALPAGLAGGNQEFREKYGFF